MLKHSKTSPLKVSLLTISPHNRAILEFFFAGAGRNLFRVVSEVEADAFILDHDYPGAKEDWDRHANSRKPGIILSVHSVELPNTIWIPKPLTSKALSEAAERVYGLLEQSESGASTSSPSVLADKSPTKVDRYSLPESPRQTASDPVRDTLFRDMPQPFGIQPNAARKARSLLMDTADEEVAPPPPKPVEKKVETSFKGVFDPAETDISMDEIGRPSQTTISPEEAERRWKQLCGEQDDVQNPATWKAEAVMFTPENYLLASILEAVKTARDTSQMVQIKLPSFDYVLIRPEVHYVYSTIDTRSDKFASLCNNPLQTGEIALHIPGGAELAQLEKQAENDTDATLDLEAFVWVCCLLTAKGRLARGVDINQKVALKHWPNLTRLEQFPHIMRISALWNQRPSTLFDIAKALNVPQRYVFSFYTAANTLNLFELDQTKLKSREKEKPKESRGLFSRLLKRLLGGGSK
ncbi:MAG: hypothetical protein RI964_1192 [Pseudomonadota bacterium]|jgi:hypothetical protein